jgi:class I fructose-bisphosphate aldolase
MVIASRRAERLAEERKDTMEKTIARRVRLADLDLPTGKRTRLYRLLYRHGPANGTLLILPIDQGLEHGPRDFFPNPPSADPEFQLRLAREGGFSGIALQIGLAERYMRAYAGEVPLILKLNGKTDIPSDEAAFSPQTATVADAVRLGADAVGYTLYVGSPAQDRDFLQFMRIREDCERFGMPIIVWAYPRGAAIQAKGGRDSQYAIEYAARVAHELGADVIKLNIPKRNPERDALSPPPYNQLELSEEESLRRVIEAAGRSLVIISGGEKVDDERLMHRVSIAVEAGATGFIFGRNVWQRPYDEALALSQRIRDVLLRYPA